MSAGRKEWSILGDTQEVLDSTQIVKDVNIAKIYKKKSIVVIFTPRTIYEEQHI